jgi:hypothetical protein
MLFVIGIILCFPAHHANRFRITVIGGDLHIVPQSGRKRQINVAEIGGVRTSVWGQQGGIALIDRSGKLVVTVDLGAQGYQELMDYLRHSRPELFAAPQVKQSQSRPAQSAQAVQVAQKPAVAPSVAYSQLVEEIRDQQFDTTSVVTASSYSIHDVDAFLEKAQQYFLSGGRGMDEDIRFLQTATFAISHFEKGYPLYDVDRFIDRLIAQVKNTALRTPGSVQAAVSSLSVSGPSAVELSRKLTAKDSSKYFSRLATYFLILAIVPLIVVVADILANPSDVSAVLCVVMGIMFVFFTAEGVIYLRKAQKAKPSRMKRAREAKQARKMQQAQQANEASGAQQTRGTKRMSEADAANGAQFVQPVKQRRSKGDKPTSNGPILG